MSQKKRHFYSFYQRMILFCCIFLMVQQSYALIQTREGYRKAYQQSLMRVKLGKSDIQSDLQRLEGYPLKEVLHYEYLTRNFDRVKESDILHYILKNQDSVTAQLLHRKWLGHLFKSKQYANYIQFYSTEVSNQRLTCHYLDALLRQGADIQLIQSQIESIWVKPSNHHKSCNPVFKRWMSAGYLSNEIIWKRAYALISQGNYSKHLLAYLLKLSSGKTEYYIRGLVRVMKNPHRLDHYMSDLNPYRKDFVKQVLPLLVKISPNQVTYLIQRYDQYFISASEREQMLHQINLVLLNRGNFEILNSNIEEYPYAQFYFYRPFLKDEFLELKARRAIRNENWPIVINSIAHMSDPLQKKSVFRYWLAKSLMKVKYISPFAHQNLLLLDSEEAKLNRNILDLNLIGKSILQELSAERHFYGYMAASLLQKQPQLNHKRLQYTEAMYQKTFRHKGIQRVLELQIMNPLMAKRELRHVTSYLSKEEKRLVPYIMYHQKIYTDAIFMALKTDFRDDLLIRFPVLHEKIVDRFSKKYDVDKSLIYAVIRQESSFRSQVKSSQNAQGLMQILPSTANWLSKKYLNNHRMNLFNISSNIQLGTIYLKYLGQRFENNRILMAAAYNAGPTNLMRWLNRAKSREKPMDVDVFIENITFKETRHYVQAVLVFDYIYQNHLSPKGNAVFLKPSELRVL